MATDELFNQIAAQTADRKKESDAAFAVLNGGKVSQEMGEDPELTAIFKRFAYGDIVRQTPKLTEKQRQLLSLAALTTRENYKMLETHVEMALNVGATPLEVRETLYQLAPYIGFGNVYEALNHANSVFTRRGIQLPLADQGTVTDETRVKKGSEIQLGIYGDFIRNNRKNSPDDQMHIQVDLAADCFGDFYTRGTLDFKMRELINIVSLAAQGGVDKELEGHIKGSLKVGNDRETVVQAFTVILPFLGYPKTLHAMEAINKVAPLK